MLAVLALLAVTLGAVIALQTASGLYWMRRELEREATDVSKLFALKHREVGVQGGPSLERLADIAFHDPHVAFLVVRDAEGRAVAERIRDRVAFETFERVTRRCSENDLICAECKAFGMSGHKGSAGQASTQALWSASGELVGAVTIGIVDPAYHAMGMRLVRAGVVGGLAVGVIAVPLVAMGARRLGAPLRRVATAAEDLAAGKRPEPIVVRGPREVASLAESFNRMAGELDVATGDLRAANDRLESTVRERTRELRRVNARLELELGERARFFRAMSHDLGAPLRNIAGALLLLRKRHERSLPAEALDTFDRVEKSIELELGMLRELLEISRLGAAEERPEAVETGAIANDLRQTFDHDLRTRSIDLVVRAPMPVVSVEPARFRQALQNLVDNAVKYMGDSPVRRIEISARPSRDMIEFVVADTGPGIPPREHDRIFEVFRRASTTPQSIKGSGVGLAAVKAIVERWGGTIRVESELGHGSAFIFTTPAERLVSIDDAGRWTENRAEAENAPRRGSDAGAAGR